MAGSTTPSRAPRDTQWAEGLRGIAAVGVVSSHLTLSFARQYVTPCTEGRDGPSLLFQRPILRLIIQGPAFVALFFILLGFVNSLKPLKQAKNNQIEEALFTLARGALNRAARLVFPATAVTILAWYGCQLNLFEMARNGDAYWLRVNSKAPSPSWGTALWDLVLAVRGTWVLNDNPYDQPQWALKFLFAGSMSTFLILLAVITTRPAFRIYALVALYGYSWTSGDFLVGFNVYFGIFLAQLHTSSFAISTPLSCMIPTKFRHNLVRYTPLLTTILALTLMSFPSSFVQDARWSRVLDNLGRQITPGDSDLSRFWPGLGAQLLCLSIYSSPSLLQPLLSKDLPVYLGSVSFSLYLLHGPLMCSALAVMIYAPAVLRGLRINADLENGWEGVYPLPRPITYMTILPVFGTFLMICVHAWSTKVEPVFARWTRALEEFATGKREFPRSPLCLPTEKMGD